MTGAFDTRFQSYAHLDLSLGSLFDIYLIPQTALHSQALGLISIITAHGTRFVSQISPPITTTIPTMYITFSSVRFRQLEFCRGYKVGTKTLRDLHAKTQNPV